MNLHRFDFSTRELTTWPDSDGLWTARWSPDGRYVAALRARLSNLSPELKLFDLTTQKWRSLARVDSINEPTWSRDSKYIYFDTTTPGDPALYRVRVRDDRLEPLASLKGIPRIGNTRWSGVAHDGSPLIPLGVSLQEIYALEVDWP